MFNYCSIISAESEEEVHHTVFLIWVKDSSPGSVLERSSSHENPKNIVCLRLKGRVPGGIKQLAVISGVDRDFNKKRTSKYLILFEQMPNCNACVSWSSPFSLIIDRKLPLKASFTEELVRRNLVVCRCNSNQTKCRWSPWACSVLTARSVPATWEIPNAGGKQAVNLLSLPFSEMEKAHHWKSSEGHFSPAQIRAAQAQWKKIFFWRGFR